MSDETSDGEQASWDELNLAVSPAEAKVMRTQDGPERIADNDYVKAVFHTAEPGDELIMRDRKTPLTVVDGKDSDVTDAYNVSLEGRGNSEFFVNVPDDRRPTLYYKQPGQGSDTGSYKSKGTVYFAMPVEEFDEDTRYGYYEVPYLANQGRDVVTELIPWYPDIEDEHMIVVGYCEDVGREGFFAIPKRSL